VYFFPGSTFSKAARYFLPCFGITHSPRFNRGGSRLSLFKSAEVRVRSAELKLKPS
jgi:hypothetical protein